MQKRFFLFAAMLLLFAGWKAISANAIHPKEKEQVSEDPVRAMYQKWPDKGAVKNKRRATIMVEKNVIRRNDTLLVYHVYEELKKNRFYSVVDHKSVCNEFIGDSLTGCPPDSSYTAFWFCDCPNDSVMLVEQAETNGPGIMTNFDNTKYIFHRPGTYTIVWKPGEQVSNTLTITVQ